MTITDILCSNSPFCVFQRTIYISLFFMILSFISIIFYLSIRELIIREIIKISQEKERFFLLEKSYLEKECHETK